MLLHIQVLTWYICALVLLSVESERLVAAVCKLLVTVADTVKKVKKAWSKI